MDEILHPSHWFHSHDHHKCLYPFKVIANIDYQGSHKNKEISFKKGDIIQVSAQCDANGHNVVDVPRKPTKLSNGVIDVKYPVYPESSAIEQVFWVGRVMKFNPDASHYAMTHDVGHFPVKYVSLIKRGETRTTQKNDQKANNHITVRMSSSKIMLQNQDSFTATFTDKSNLGFTFRTVKAHNADNMFTVVESVEDGSEAELADVEPFFLLSKIGEINVETKSHVEIEKIISESNFPIQIFFLHPSHEKHPQNHVQHHKHMEHVTNIEAKTFDDLNIKLEYAPSVIEGDNGGYMFVSSSEHIPLKDFVLSRVNFHSVMDSNLGKEDINKLLSDPNEPGINLAFLSPSHPGYPKRPRKKDESSKDTKSHLDSTDVEKNVYYHIFQEGPMGIGLEPKPGESVGSVVSVVVENSQAYNSDSIRVGDTVEKIENIDITAMEPEAVLQVLQKSKRPVRLQFSRAPYHLKDKSKEKAAIALWDEILQSGSKNINAKDLMSALKPINIVLDEAQANLVIEHIEEDFAEETLKYEDFLYGAFSICKEAQRKKSKSNFTSPDGKSFDDKGAYRKYMMETFYSFSDKQNLRGEQMLIKYPGEVENVPFDIKDIDNCEIAILGFSPQVQIDDAINSRIFVGPVNGTLFIRGCNNVNFTVACRQLRMLNCTNCTLNLYVGTDPCIEKSTGIVFKPFNGAYNALSEHFKAANLDPSDNHWHSVFDFNADGKDGFDASVSHFNIVAEKDEDWVLGSDDVQPSLTKWNPVPSNATLKTKSDVGYQFTENKSHNLNDKTKEAGHSLQTSMSIIADLERVVINSRESSSTVSSSEFQDEKSEEKTRRKQGKMLKLAQKAHSKGKFAKAEMLYRKLNMWQRACFMYFQNEKYESAKRVALKEGGQIGYEEVIFSWAKHLGEEKGRDFILEFGGVKAAIDFYIDRCEFKEAFGLTKLKGGKKKLKEIHYKYAQFLEDAGNFPAAEKHYVEAGQPREAIEMYKREDKAIHALRVAKDHDPAHVVDLEHSLKLTVVDLLNTSKTGLFAHRSLREMQADLSQRVNLRGNDRRQKGVKRSARSRERDAKNSLVVEKRERGYREMQRVAHQKRRQRMQKLSTLRETSHNAYKKAFKSVTDELSDFVWDKASMRQQYKILRASQRQPVDLSKFKIQKFDPRKKTILRRHDQDNATEMKRLTNEHFLSPISPRKPLAGVSKDGKESLSAKGLKSSRFSPRPPDIFKMARRKNRRLRASPLINSNRKHVVSNLSAPKEEAKTFEADKVVNKMNATLVKRELAPKAPSLRPRHAKKKKLSKSHVRSGETMIEGDELELVLHSDQMSFTIL